VDEASDAGAVASSEEGFGGSDVGLLEGQAVALFADDADEGDGGGAAFAELIELGGAEGVAEDDLDAGVAREVAFGGGFGLGEGADGVALREEFADDVAADKPGGTRDSDDLRRGHGAMIAGGVLPLPVALNGERCPEALRRAVRGSCWFAEFDEVGGPSKTPHPPLARHLLPVEATGRRRECRSCDGAGVFACGVAEGV
jgi:hypothetical protein